MFTQLSSAAPYSFFPPSSITTAEIAECFRIKIIQHVPLRSLMRRRRAAEPVKLEYSGVDTVTRFRFLALHVRSYAFSFFLPT